MFKLRKPVLSSEYNIGQAVEKTGKQFIDTNQPRVWLGSAGRGDEKGLVSK